MPNSFSTRLLTSLLIIGSVTGGWFVTQVFDYPASKQNSGASQFVQDDLQPQNLEKQWIVSGVQGQKLLENGAVLLDTRSCRILLCRNPLNALDVKWQDFSQSEFPHWGKLLTDKQVLSQKLQSLGIDKDKPVIVAGNPKSGWGENGRIVWMLRTLGHTQAVLVDGGYSALVAVESSRIKQENKGNFVVEKRDDWLVNKEELKKLIKEENILIIDSRSPREYAGRNPHGEPRGGHIPRAINLHYRELMDDQGKLRSRENILAELAAKEIYPEDQIVIYCTGGVRSAWLTVVLADLGFNAQNYAGSMWEWSAGDEKDYPLLSK